MRSDSLGVFNLWISLALFIAIVILAFNVPTKAEIKQSFHAAFYADHYDCHTKYDEFGNNPHGNGYTLVFCENKNKEILLRDPLGVLLR